MNIDEDIHIIDGCKQYSRVAQEQLYKKTCSMFMKVCMRYAKDIHDAEQVLQDGYLKVFTHIEKFQGNGSFEGWMRRVFVNTCLDYLKSKQVKNHSKVDYPEESHSYSHFTSRNDALDNIAIKELMEIIHSLPPMSKTVFNLFAFEGYSHREISELLSISEGTSQWHVNNARKSLQQKINLFNIKEKERHEQNRI